MRYILIPTFPLTNISKSCIVQKHKGVSLEASTFEHSSLFYYLSEHIS